MTLQSNISPSEWKDALELELRSEAHSGAATALVETLVDRLFYAEPEGTLKASTVIRRRRALGALLADLLKLHAKGLVGYRSFQNGSIKLPIYGFGVDVFRAVVNAMEAGGLLHVDKGYQRISRFEATTISKAAKYVTGGGHTRLKLSPDALDDIEAAGVAIDAWGEHWKRSASAKPEAIAKAVGKVRVLDVVELQTAKVRQGKRHLGGEPIPFELDEPGVRDIVEDVEAHNAFMTTYGVDGIDFLGLRRIYNDGNRPAHRWKAGGRFYSLTIKGTGTPYENMKAEKRLDVIRLGGGQVDEVDMSASQLRLLYAVQGVPIPTSSLADPYAIAGFERDPVKRVVAQALGRGAGRYDRWGRQAIAEYKKETGGRSLPEDFEFLSYQEATLTAHPILETLGLPNVPGALRLQWIESEIIRRAMSELRTQGIGSLPVHDSLLVPCAAVGAAMQALGDAFIAQVEDVTGYSTNHFAVVKRKAA